MADGTEASKDVPARQAKDGKPQWQWLALKLCPTPAVCMGQEALPGQSSSAQAPAKGSSASAACPPAQPVQQAADKLNLRFAPVTLSCMECSKDACKQLILP